MSNIYDIYLQFKATGAVKYKDELLVFSKEIDTVLSQKSTDEDYSTCYILPFYQIVAMIKKEFTARKKYMLHKIYA